MPTATLTSPRRGGTLIEVLAALALLAGVLSSSLVGIAKYRAASADARLRTRATVIADDLLTQWRSIGAYPARSEGELDNPGWRWRTDAKPFSIESIRGAEIVRLEILAPEREAPILTVEFLTAPPPPAAAPQQEDAQEVGA